MNSREPGHIPVKPGSGRASRLRRRRRKRIALFASFAVIIILIALAVVLLALEISEASAKLKDNDGSDVTTADTSDTSGDNVIASGYTAADGLYSINEGVLLLVNSTHEYVFPATESRMVNVYDALTKNSYGVYSYKCSYTTVRMDKTALTAFNGMMDAFYADTKNTYALVSDAYRTYTEQESKSIPAGYSDHHTGYLVSLKFYDDTGIYTSDNSTKYSDAYAWLNEHAAEYGFVVRYPGNKSIETGISDYTYCYRYVGIAHATYMSAQGLCLEEYITLLKSSYTFDGEHLKITDASGVNYEVYYIPSTGDNTKIYVPVASGGYEISGDNDSGFIVTVTLS